MRNYHEIPQSPSNIIKKMMAKIGLKPEEQIIEETVTSNGTSPDNNISDAELVTQ